MAVPADSTILAVQTEVGLEDLATEDDEGFSPDTVVALEQYASKVSSQSLTLPMSSFGPTKTATSLEDKTILCLGMAWATPFAPVPQPPAHLPHILIQGVHPSLARAVDSCLHSPLFVLPLQREGSCEQQRHPYVGNWGFRPSFTLAVVIILCAVRKALASGFY